MGIRTDAQQAGAMEPLLTPGAVVILDRHYNSLAPYRAHQPTLYAVRAGASLLIRFVEFDEGRLILRPYSMNFPVQLLALGGMSHPRITSWAESAWSSQNSRVLRGRRIF